ncbi:hypothetical protein L3Q82_025440, partial [Scortum barcoo]
MRCSRTPPPIVMKCFERLVMAHHCVDVTPQQRLPPGCVLDSPFTLLTHTAQIELSDREVADDSCGECRTTIRLQQEGQASALYFLRRHPLRRGGAGWGALSPDLLQMCGGESCPPASSCGTAAARRRRRRRLCRGWTPAVHGTAHTVCPPPLRQAGGCGALKAGPQTEEQLLPGSCETVEPWRTP